MVYILLLFLAFGEVKHDGIYRKGIKAAGNASRKSEVKI